MRNNIVSLLQYEGEAISPDAAASGPEGSVAQPNQSYGL